MKHIRNRLSQQIHGNIMILQTPIMFRREQPQPLRPGQRILKPLYPAGVVVLGLVEDLLLLQQLQDLAPRLQEVVAEQELGYLGDGEV